MLFQSTNLTWASLLGVTLAMLAVTAQAEPRSKGGGGGGPKFSPQKSQGSFNHNHNHNFQFGRGPQSGHGQNGPKFPTIDLGQKPLDPGMGNGRPIIKPNFPINPIKPIDPGFGNGQGGTFPPIVRPNLPIKPLDPGIGNGTGGKLPIVKPNFPIKPLPIKPLEPGFNSPKIKFPIGKPKLPYNPPHCDPKKSWNPWFDACKPWYNPNHPCFAFDPCDPCHHWHPVVRTFYVPCPEVTICDPGFIPLSPAFAAAPCDLELVDLRLVDWGIADQQLGPCFRVLLRNNSQVDSAEQFQVTVLGTAGGAPTAQAPRASATVQGLKAGETRVEDIRLKLEALQSVQPTAAATLAAAPGAQPSPAVTLAAAPLQVAQPAAVVAAAAAPAIDPAAFKSLMAVIDSRQQIAETSESNNAAVFNRDELKLVNPTIRGLDRQSASTGSELVILGEGFGAANGEVVLETGGLKFKGEIVGWQMQAMKIRLPKLALTQTIAGKLTVVRSDGQSSNTVDVEVTAS